MNNITNINNNINNNNNNNNINNNNNNNNNNNFNDITHLTQREQLLLRPDMMAGDCTIHEEEEFFIDTNSIKYGINTYSACLSKMFDEALTNATDNYQRNKNLKDPIEIDLTYDHFRIKNYGPTLEIKIDPKLHKYIPEIAFAEFNTSSNYDDSKERYTNGRNGVGIKLTNTFSKIFIINIVSNGQKYSQVFQNNLSIINPPKIIPTNEKNSVEIICYPDFTYQFLNQFKNISGGNMSHLMFRAFSTVLFGRNVIINGQTYPGMTFNKFSILLAMAYLNKFNSNISEYEHYDYSTQFSTVSVYIVPFKLHKQLSYVNNIYTSENGSHVDTLLQQIRNKFKNDSKSESSPINYLLILINQNVNQPEFNSQAKNKLITKINVDYSQLVNKLIKSESLAGYMYNKPKKTKIAERIFYEKCQPANKAGTKERQKCTLFITEGDSATSMVNKGFAQFGHDYFGVYTLRGKVLNVRKATNEKIDKNKIVMNLLRELGLQRGSNYSISDLRYGRIVMVKDADVDGDAIMGLVYNIFFTFFKSLLLQNFFYEFTTPAFQIILKDKLNKKGLGFSNNVKLEFTTEAMLNNKLKETPKNKIDHIHYMKGLGSITDEDAKRYFSNIDKHLILITIHNETKPIKGKFGEYDDIIYGPKKADEYMEMVYSNSKINIDKRKNWVMSCDPKKVLERANGMNEMPIVLFQHLSNIHFALDNCHRSMVNIVDGLKPSYRKIMYTLFSKGNTATSKTEKVAAVAGEVTKFAKYMHGEASLQETIFTMMKYWAGTNNIPLLNDHGSIGSRLGDKHAQARYVFLTLSSLARLIYIPDDDPILIPSYDEGEQVEPEYYVPIIPMTLINGSKGIGTGFSNLIPQHNQYDCINYIKTTLNYPENLNSLVNFPNELSPINPYYPECNVKVEITDKGYVTYGSQEWIFPKVTKNEIFWKTSLLPGKNGKHPLDYNPAYLKITEIPIGCNLKTIIEQIQKMLGEKSNQTKKDKGKKKDKKESEDEMETEELIKNVKKNCWPLIIDLINNSVCGSHVQYDKVEVIFKIDNSKPLPINFEIIPMKTQQYLTNMTMISESGKIIRHDSIYTLINHYMIVRFAYYIKRKAYVMNSMIQNLYKISNRARFIKFKVEGLENVIIPEEGKKYLSTIRNKTKLDGRGIPEKILIKIMEINKFNKMKDNLMMINSQTNEGNYDYIIDYVNTRRETLEQYKKLIDEAGKVKQEYINYSSLHVKDLWLKELNILENELRKVDEINKEMKSN